MTTKRRKAKPDQFHMHEALDRTYLAGFVVETMLAEHPGVLVVPVAATKIRRAADLLASAYQAIGRHHLGKDQSRGDRPAKRAKRTRGKA